MLMSRPRQTSKLCFHVSSLTLYDTHTLGLFAAVTRECGPQRPTVSGPGQWGVRGRVMVLCLRQRIPDSVVANLIDSI